MSNKKTLILSILVLFLFTHCAFQKRLYNKGYYVEWLSNTKQKNKKLSPYIENQQLSVLPINTNFSSNKKENENLLAEIKDVQTISKHSYKNKSIKDTCGDKIILKTGDEYFVKVIEVSDKEIKYKRCDHFDGPLYSISASKVYLIEYANGFKEHIVVNSPIEEKTSTDKNIGKKYSTRYYLALIWFILSFFILGPLGYLLALFTSRNALREIKSRPDLYTGKGEMKFIFYFTLYTFLIAGIILAVVGLFTFILSASPIQEGLLIMGIGTILFLLSLLFLKSTKKDGLLD